MKFTFENDPSTDITAISHALIVSRNCPSNTRTTCNIQKEQNDVKKQLINAVEMFRTEIDKQLKTQQILKRQISTLTKESPQKEINEQEKINIWSKQKSAQSLQNKSQPQIANFEATRFQKSSNQNSKSNQSNKVGKKQEQKPDKNRSIKSELLAKGYPVSHKNPSITITQSNKSKLPYRFNLKN